MSTSTSIRPVARRILRNAHPQHLPPTFLLPSLLAPKGHSSPFSATTPLPFPRDHNRERGVSTARRTGVREPLSVSKIPLPRPVLDPRLRAKVETDPNHGLWGFFHSKEKPMNKPSEDLTCGRGWSVAELRGKSWEDLHALWWVCVKERNIIATEKFERRRLEAGYGENEGKARDAMARVTMRGIKHALTERYYAWSEAQLLAEEQGELDLSTRTLTRPQDFYEDEEEVMPAEGLLAEPRTEEKTQTVA
ncbi:putative 54S ribosomal protein L4, mitochondrial [Amylocarpus encephaloides]|uniref:Large ribosomal subunit protein uL29m n=1 Tax=Amylocarpus encephaloides TaxID=45428 RepID=A0A9P7YC81_9HELO|nr:putative 54S ribosomal protein L4, mitochondrial [Amylocarpus encephaloides]